MKLPASTSVIVPLLIFANVHATPLLKAVERRAACENTPTSRDCWGQYSINTDPSTTWPNTGRTVNACSLFLMFGVVLMGEKYDFRIKNVTLAPDGVPRMMLTVNGQYPGPAIEANWGDDIVVTVHNDLQNNGTAIHWHGVIQKGTGYADGAVSQTQCPIAPGDSFTYRWKAIQHGFSWYHSHESLQYSEGVLGPIIIHGPKTANYDIDTGPILLTDWYHRTAFSLAESIKTNQLGLPPLADTGLVNGKNTWQSGGSRWTTTFQKGKSHLLRLVNTGNEVTFKASIDGHTMKVVSMDWVPIEPYETDTLFIGVGQRYEVIVEADQEEKDYWFRAVPMLSCLAANQRPYDIRGIIRYDASSTADPTTASHTIIDACVDEPLDKLVPWHNHTVGQSDLTKSVSAQLLPNAGDNLALQWFMNGANYKPPKDDPAAKRTYESTAPLSSSFAPIDLTSLGLDKWVYLVIQSTLPLAHPVHLHGQDHYVIARGSGVFSDNLAGIDVDNPPRRDTTHLPPTGFLVIAFRLENPGSWLLHCHYVWHLHGGLGMTILEGTRSQISAVFSGAARTELARVCNNWKSSGLDGKGE